jgi:hypothetical protein
MTIQASLNLFLEDRAQKIKDLEYELNTTAHDIRRQQGIYLLEVKERLNHGEFQTWLQENFRWSNRTARRYIAAAKRTDLSVLEGSDSAKRKTFSDLEGDQEQATDVSFLEGGDQSSEYRGKDNPNRHDVHLTPHKYIPAIEAAFEGYGLWLDPFSNSHDTPNIPAAVNYTIEDNALEQDWNLDTIFFNPPYSKKSISLQEVADKFVEEWTKHPIIKRAIGLVPSYTDTRWWAKLQDIAAMTCFVEGRVPFLDARPATSEIRSQIPQCLYLLHQGR